MVPFLLSLCAVWFGFIVGRLMLLRALHKEVERRQDLIEKLEAARKEVLEKERRAAVLIERQRVARDLHDTLAQSFTGIVLHLEAAEQALQETDTLARHHLDQARKAARAGLAEGRNLIHALRPLSLAEASLAEAVRKVAARFSQETKIPIDVDADDGRPLHGRLEVALLLSVQEGLANLAKHAAAKRGSIHLHYLENQVHLLIRDDGIGFDPKELRPSNEGGLGLLGLTERASQLGGHLEIESTKGGGTMLRLNLPAYSQDSSP